MNRLVTAALVLVVCVCPMTLHASIWHTTQQKAVPHEVVRHPQTRHYTQKAQQHEVVKNEHVRYYTRKAHTNKAARHLHHKKHKKVGHS